MSVVLKKIYRIGSRSHPIKKILHVDLRCVGLEHSGWLSKLFFKIGQTRPLFSLFEPTTFGWESPPITTRPGLPPKAVETFTSNQNAPK